MDIGVKWYTSKDTKKSSKVKGYDLWQRCWTGVLEACGLPVLTYRAQGECTGPLPAHLWVLACHKLCYQQPTSALRVILIASPFKDHKVPHLHKDISSHGKPGEDEGGGLTDSSS